MGDVCVKTTANADLIVNAVLNFYLMELVNAMKGADAVQPVNAPAHAAPKISQLFVLDKHIRNP